MYENEFEGDDAKDKYMKQFFESIRYADIAPEYKTKMKLRK